MSAAAAKSPRCFLCEDAIEPGEPFKLVQAYLRTQTSPELPPQKGTVRVSGSTGFRITQRAVHYACELGAIAAAGAASRDDDAPEIIVDGDDGEELTTREKLARLMGVAVDIVDIVDELL